QNLGGRLLPVHERHDPLTPLQVVEEHAERSDRPVRQFLDPPCVLDGEDGILAMPPLLLKEDRPLLDMDLAAQARLGQFPAQGGAVDLRAPFRLAFDQEHLRLTARFPGGTELALQLPHLRMLYTRSAPPGMEGCRGKTPIARSMCRGDDRLQ